MVSQLLEAVTSFVRRSGAATGATRVKWELAAQIFRWRMKSTSIIIIIIDKVGEEEEEDSAPIIAAKYTSELLRTSVIVKIRRAGRSQMICTVLIVMDWMSNATIDQIEGEIHGKGWLPAQFSLSARNSPV